MGTYDRKNKLPYSINYTLDVQWQPRNDIVVEIGYVGNLGRHQVIPTPFNQSQIASPASPIRGQNYTYGYTIVDSTAIPPSTCPDGTLLTWPTTKAATWICACPISAIRRSRSTTGRPASRKYNAAQIHVDKRMGHGFQAGASYTFSHTTDEQSALGLFYTGDNPTNLRSGYGLADFDRKHVLNFTYTYQLHNFEPEGSLKGGVHQRLEPERPDRSAERAALQRHRLTRRGGQHLSTASPTASTIPSCRWLPAARRRAPLPANPAHGLRPTDNRRSRRKLLHHSAAQPRRPRTAPSRPTIPMRPPSSPTGSATSSARRRRDAPSFPGKAHAHRRSDQAALLP